MPARRALRIARNETTNKLETSKVAFHWEDVDMLEDDSDNEIGYGKPMTWVRTTYGSFYIEGLFEDVVAEWDAHEVATDNQLLFTRH